MISHKLLGESFTGPPGRESAPADRAAGALPRCAPGPAKDGRPMVVFCIQRLLIAGRHRLWLRLRRYLIVFDPLTFVLD